MRITLSDGTELDVLHCGMELPMLYITPAEPMTALQAATLFTPDRMQRVVCDYGNEVLTYEDFTDMVIYNRNEYTGEALLGFRKAVTA